MDLSAAGTASEAIEALDPARYALGGRAPGRALRPRAEAGVCEVLAAAHRDQLAVVPFGGGAALATLAAPSRYDIALDLTALDAILAHEPGDLTLTAACGVRLVTLEAHLRPHRQELPLEGAHPATATLGGVLAMNASGPRRLRLGAPRDRILGARFVLADGTLARTGGRVVKNVAGYGIHRLLCGSRGALAVVLDATLKLLAAPESRVVLLWRKSAAELAADAHGPALARVEPAWWTVLGGGHASVAALGAHEDFTLALGLEDDGPWVTRQETLAVAALGTPAARLEGDEAVALRQRVTDLDPPAGTWLAFASAHRWPAALAPLLALPEARGLVFHAGSGRLVFAARAERAAACVAAALDAGFTLTDAAGIALDGLRPRGQTGVLALRARLRAELDPAGVFALGERWADYAG